ncbi:MAG: (2Fe-2S)-binding protein [Candidatus Cryosericum sp.]|nr:(2Fe-2S)-binding protein [bacterium]
MTIKIVINSVQRTFDVQPDEVLLDVLRREGYLEVKGSCHAGDCGACTILLDGRPVASCLTLAAKADGHSLTTVRGIGDQAHPNVIQDAFVKNGAVQCGYCIPGAIVSAKALLDENINPTEDEIRLAMDSNYCRCTGYEQQLEAVLSAAEQLREDGTGKVSKK